MTKEVNAFNMLHAKMKKQGCRPAFSVLVTDGNNHLATCKCSDTRKASKWVLFLYLITYRCQYGILCVIYLLFSCAELYVIKKECLLTWTVI